MTALSIITLIRKRWITILVTIVATTVVALAYLSIAPKKYSSSTQFFISTSDSSSPMQLAQGGAFTQQRVLSYVSIVTTPKVLQPVISDLRLDETVDQVASQITVTAPTNTVLLNVTATSDTPIAAQQLAQTVAKYLPATIQDLEQIGTSQPSPVKVTVLRPATIDTAPVKPRKRLTLILAVLAGLLLGIAAAASRELRDRKIRTNDDIRQTVTQPLVGEIPLDKETQKYPIALNNNRQSNRAEAYRAARTNLQYVDIASQPKVILITSSIPSEGKSTTAANLAVALAQDGARVCAVDADLRDPKLAECFGATSAVGLTEVLIGRASLEDVLQPYGELNLEILGAGHIPPNPSELLGSATMKSLLQKLASDWDYVIIDSPPVLPVTDATVLSTLADGALVVVGCNQTTRDQILKTVQTLETVQSRILGVILNMTTNYDRNALGYGYGYGHSKDRKRPETQQHTGSTLKLNDRKIEQD